MSRDGIKTVIFIACVIAAIAWGVYVKFFMFWDASTATVGDKFMTDIWMAICMLPSLAILLLGLAVVKSG